MLNKTGTTNRSLRNGNISVGLVKLKKFTPFKKTTHLITK